jgi:hypothetical protein
LGSSLGGAVALDPDPGDSEPEPADAEPVDAEPEPADAEPEPEPEAVDAEPVDAEPEPPPVVDDDPQPSTTKKIAVDRIGRSNLFPSCDGCE